MFLNVTKIFLDSQQNFRKVCKNWIFHKNDILQHCFSKSVQGLSNQAVCKTGLEIKTRKKAGKACLALVT
jgi:hypothetical protein